MYVLWSNTLNLTCTFSVRTRSTSYVCFLNVHVPTGISSKSYKTSLLYGEKTILLGDDLIKHSQVYVKFFRPLIVNDETKKQKQNPFFVTKSGKMSHSSISNCMTSLFGNIQELSKEYC